MFSSVIVNFSGIVYGHSERRMSDSFYSRVIFTLDGEECINSGI